MHITKVVLGAIVCATAVSFAQGPAVDVPFKIVRLDSALDSIVSQDAKLDIYRRLTHMTEVAEIGALEDEVRDRFGMLPEPARSFFATALLRVLGGASDIESVLVRGNEARITFREQAVPRMKGISAAFHEVQFQAEVRRAHPLSLKLTRLGGAEMLDGLVRALTTLRPT